MKIIISKGYISQRIGDKLKIFDSSKSIQYTFNGTGAFIFERIKKGLSNEEIADRLVKQFKVSKQVAMQDIDDFNRALLEKGLAVEVK